MLLSRHILLCACLTAVAVSAAQACPNHARTPAVLTPAKAPSNAASLLAWKPRVWAPALPAPARDHGLRVAIDPVDGALGMPLEPASTELLAIGDEAPVRVEHFTNGRVNAQLDERFAEFAVVTLGADGKPNWTCVHGSTGASQFMKHPVAATGKPVTAPGIVWEDK